MTLAGRLTGSGRQMQRIELERRGQLLIGQVADQGPQQIARLLELRLQRREQGLNLREGCFLRRDIDAHREAEPELIA